MNVNIAMKIVYLDNALKLRAENIVLVAILKVLNLFQ